ncbi:uncharacterized protein [Patagioenas fasciata]|uniref:uncharacterized protein n=1 Tax=Patagioenas fasciata TaxID=372321 RepID=UPI003A99DD6D
MARQLFLQPHLSPTIEKLERYELAKIWASTSYHLSLQLALHQAVRIPGIGTFAVVRKQVALSEQDLVIVERPVFRPDKAVVQDYELRYGCKDFPGHQDFEQLPYAEIASENAVSEGTVQLYMERTTHLFHAYLENRKNVAIIWRDVGMLIAEGKEIKKRFYLHFLERLNGTGKMLQALLENKWEKKEEQLPPYIQKYLEEQEEKETELAEAEAEEEMPNVEGNGEKPKEMQRSQESSSPECSSDSSSSSVESDESSCDLLEMNMEGWEEAGEEPPSVPEDNSVPQKRYEIYSTSASARRPSQALRLARDTSSKSLLRRDERQCRPARLLTPALPSVQ